MSPIYQEPEPSAYKIYLRDIKLDIQNKISFLIDLQVLDLSGNVNIMDINNDHHNFIIRQNLQNVVFEYKDTSIECLFFEDTSFNKLGVILDASNGELSIYKNSVIQKIKRKIQEKK